MVAADEIRTMSPSADGRGLDGVSTFLSMLSRVVSPEGAWSHGTDHDVAALLDVLRVTEAAMPEADAVSLTQWRGGRTRTVVASSSSASSADAAQHASRQGPFVDAIADQRTVCTDDVRADARWPVLAGLARRGTGRSAFSVPLGEAGLRNTALTVYSDRVAAWPGGARTHGLSAAVLAGAVLAMNALDRQHRIDNLQLALDSNRTIGAAVGITMGQHRCGYDEAFALLTEVSQNRNLKLRDVAEDVLATGMVPDLSPAVRRPGAGPRRDGTTAARDSAAHPFRPEVVLRSDGGASHRIHAASARSGAVARSGVVAS